jgi:hypothetical protein
MRSEKTVQAKVIEGIYAAAVSPELYRWQRRLKNACFNPCDISRAMASASSRHGLPAST